MKIKNVAHLLLYALVIAFLAPSCVKEGPMGLSGTDGTNGTAGTVTCLACHSGTTMDQKKAEFAMSEHSVGAIAVAYAGGNPSCAQCHSSQGFIEYATLGSVAGTITNPSAWECATCHGLHSKFEVADYALRLESKPVVSNQDATYKFDFKNSSNLCVNCHQARTAEPMKASVAGATTFKITSTHYGPHHGPQGNIVAGVGFAEIAGAVAYPAPGSSKHFVGACTSCHMAAFKKGQGGHSLIPSLASCNTCHTATDANYDHNGVQTEIAADLVILRNLLIAKGVVTATPDPVTPTLITYAPKVGTFPMIQAQAYFNWIGITEDRSEGVHNPPYVRALLLNSIAALK